MGHGSTWCEVNSLVDWTSEGSASSINCISLNTKVTKEFGIYRMEDWSSQKVVKDFAP
jgi:hypothetical protein